MSQDQLLALSNFKILISSDNHIGYKENHPIRGSDSFNAFEEVIIIKKQI